MQKSAVRYAVVPGPEGLLPPSASLMGVSLPDEGEGLVEGLITSEEATLEAAAFAMLTRKNPTFFPGPLMLWGWTEHTRDKAGPFFEVVNEVPGARIIPMPDYRPIYPKIDPEAVINPCHPNLTIWHNKIEACVLIGVHCHFANVTLKMIRAGTNCYTIALCAEAGHEDAMASVPNFGVEKLIRFRDTLRRLKKNGVKPLYEGMGIVPSGWAQIAGFKGLPLMGTREGVTEEGTEFENSLAHGLDEVETGVGFSHELAHGLDENEE